MTRSIARTFAVAVMSAALGCGGDDTAETTASPPSSAEPTTTAPATTEAETTAPADTTTTTAPVETTAAETTAATAADTTLPGTSEAGGVTVVEVTVAGGQVSGVPDIVSVRAGQMVRLVVTADVTDEVHVHGYNLLADVTPETPAVIEFTAEATGFFEVELEAARLPLFEFEVTP